VKAKQLTGLLILEAVGFVAAAPAQWGSGSDQEINGRGEWPHQVVPGGEVPGPGDFIRSLAGKNFN
jgi:hypothetical protein